MADRRSLERDAAAAKSRVPSDRLSGRGSASLSSRGDATMSGDRQGWRIALAASGALCMLAVWVFFALRPPERNKSGCMREHAGFIDIKPSCAEPVSIERQGDIIIAYPGAHLEESARGLRVRQGRVSFVVSKREASASLRVLVSHGAIEVVGTRFTITQEDERGKVRLEEGDIKFHWTSGEESTLVPGDELEWPPRPKPAPMVLDAVPLEAPEEVEAPPKSEPPPKPQAPPKPRRPAPPRPAETPNDEQPEEAPPEPEETTGPMLMEDVLKKMSALRGQQRNREALELLRAQSDRSDFSGLQQARLSFEIGVLLQDRMDDKAGACAHWKQHARRYPDDASHADRVQEYIGACEEAP